MTAVTTTSSSVSEKRAANALGGKTARPCDSCLGRRARWYCAADDAFLCQSCDSSVHSANPLARRHERVRLKASSLKASDDGLELSLPPWNHGFCQKARTPRHAKPAAILQRKVEPMQNPLLVPEIHDDAPLEDNEEQLLYRVPIFDPMVSEFCNSSSEPVSFKEDVGISPKPSIYHGRNDGLLGFIPSEIDLAEFAADVESLLGKGFDEDSFYMEKLLDPKKEDHLVTCFEPRRVKLELEEDTTMGVDESAEGCNFEVELDFSRETLDLNFDCDSQTTTEEVEEKLTVSTEGNESLNKRKGSFLRLDYEAVIAAWIGSPWTTSERPKFNPNDYWPDCTGASASEIHVYGDMARVGAQVTVTDGGREARVSRYREKRRTRLFSKKIRYEVRKLNAEKRPRMKGRFVKRSSLVSPPFPY